MRILFTPALALVLSPASAKKAGANPLDPLAPRRKLEGTCGTLEPSCGGKGSVTCANGNVTDANGDPTMQTCADACDGDCCIGEDACWKFYGTVCRDGSCNGPDACAFAADWDGFIGLIGGAYIGTASGPSCVGEWACRLMGNYGGNVASVSDGSCIGTKACNDLGYDSGVVGHISGGCIGEKACNLLGYDETLGDIVGCCNSDSQCVGASDDGDLPDTCAGQIGEDPCADDPHWYTTLRRCNWHGKGGVYARDACKKTCGTCTDGEACEDDPEWKRMNKGNMGCEHVKMHGCDWVAQKNSERRCTFTGVDGCLASAACKATCNTCID